MTIHAVDVTADPKSPRFGAGPRDDAPGIYVDWAVEDSGLCKNDRFVKIILNYKNISKQLYNYLEKNSSNVNNYLHYYSTLHHAKFFFFFLIILRASTIRDMKISFLKKLERLQLSR